MTGKKLNQSDALKFIFAGKSTFTVINTQTDNRFTFSLKISKTSNLFFVKVLSGPETYTYIGTCANGYFKHSKKSVIANDSTDIISQNKEKNVNKEKIIAMDTENVISELKTIWCSRLHHFLHF